MGQAGGPLERSRFQPVDSRRGIMYDSQQEQ